MGRVWGRSKLNSHSSKSACSQQRPLSLLLSPPPTASPLVFWRREEVLSSFSAAIATAMITNLKVRQQRLHV